MAESVLVIGATSRQGFQTCKALVATQKFEVYGTSRSVPNGKLGGIGVQALKFDQGDRAALDEALKASKASMVFAWTDFYVGAKQDKAREVEQGKLIIDACVAAGVRHVVLSSVSDADKAPENVTHFKAKHEQELYLQASGVPSWSILRPVAFLENFDDPATWNPLKKGHIKSIWRHDLKVKLIATEDIGKAAAAMFLDPAAWNGRTLDCASCDLTGDELAEALSEASGTPCRYSMAMPSFVVNCFMRDLANMVRFFEDPGYSADIDEFRKVVPDAMDAKAYFTKLGQWHNGEKFAPKS